MIYGHQEGFNTLGFTEVCTCLQETHPVLTGGQLLTQSRNGEMDTSCGQKGFSETRDTPVHDPDGTSDCLEAVP